MTERLETWWHEFGDDDADGEEAARVRPTTCSTAVFASTGLSRHGCTGARLLREFRAPAPCAFLIVVRCRYQRTAIRWMWALHSQGAGGIIGDEVCYPL